MPKIIRILSKHLSKCSMKIFWKFPTVNLSKCNFWLVICIELFYQIQSNRFVNLIVEQTIIKCKNVCSNTHTHTHTHTHYENMPSLPFPFCQNLFTVKPQIGEKTVSSQQPGIVQRGSRQALHCTSHGVPPPKIQWLWHPCPTKGL